MVVTGWSPGVRLRGFSPALALLSRSTSLGLSFCFCSLFKANLPSVPEMPAPFAGFKVFSISSSRAVSFLLPWVILNSRQMHSNFSYLQKTLLQVLCPCISSVAREGVARLRL